VNGNESHWLSFANQKASRSGDADVREAGKLASGEANRLDTERGALRATRAVTFGI
jgi:hypothetical protein